MSTIFINSFWQAAKTYAEILRDDYGASEVWPLVNIAAGTAIPAFINSARDGTLTGWDLQNAAGPVPGTLAPFSDGANDEGNIYTSNGVDGLADIFDSSEGSFALWVKADSSAVWTDGEFRVILYMDGATSTDRVQIRKNSTNNQILFQWVTGGAPTNITHTISSTADILIGASWSNAANQFIGYVNGSSVGTVAAGTWGTSLTKSFIGVQGAISAQVWHGLLSYAAFKFGSVWTPTDFANIYAAAATARAD